MGFCKMVKSKIYEKNKRMKREKVRKKLRKLLELDYEEVRIKNLVREFSIEF